VQSNLNIYCKVHNPVSTPASKGFSLMELMVVLVLIGFLITMVAPRLSRRSQSSEWKNILSDLNSLAQLSKQESMAEQVVFRLNFIRGKNNEPDSAVVERQGRLDEKSGKLEFVKVHSTYLTTLYTFAANVRLRAIYLGKQEILNESGQAACYFVPDGLAQNVYVQLARTEDKKEEMATLKMIPFAGQFELEEKLIRPDQEG
jgi:prepilin-type N-terminal cleavage/methylation domain-containing protein